MISMADPFCHRLFGAGESIMSPQARRPSSRCRSDISSSLCRRREPASVVEAEAAELLGVTLPVFGDLDVQVEVDLGAEEGLDLVASPAADVLQPGSAGAD